MLAALRPRKKWLFGTCCVCRQIKRLLWSLHAVNLARPPIQIIITMAIQEACLMVGSLFLHRRRTTGLQMAFPPNSDIFPPTANPSSLTHFRQKHLAKLPCWDLPYHPIIRHRVKLLLSRQGSSYRFKLCFIRKRTVLVVNPLWHHIIRDNRPCHDGPNLHQN